MSLLHIERLNCLARRPDTHKTGYFSFAIVCFASCTMEEIETLAAFACFGGEDLEPLEAFGVVTSLGATVLYYLL